MESQIILNYIKDMSNEKLMELGNTGVLKELVKSGRVKFSDVEKGFIETLKIESIKFKARPICEKKMEELGIKDEKFKYLYRKEFETNLEKAYNNTNEFNDPETARKIIQQIQDKQNQK